MDENNRNGYNSGSPYQSSSGSSYNSSSGYNSSSSGYGSGYSSPSSGNTPSSTSGSSPYGGGSSYTPPSGYGSSQPNKVIDVTKPKEKYTPPSASIDPSMVSDYTLREQQSLERLKKKIGESGGSGGSKSGSVKTIIAIVLVIILIVLAVVFVMVLGGGEDPLEDDFDMRLSMQIENKSELHFMTQAGLKELREINPGDKIPLKAEVRNSNNIEGDPQESGKFPPTIYIRFKIVFILDYKERYDVIVPTMQDEKWYRYNKAEEDSINNGVLKDDHYYYYKDKLIAGQEEQLFSEITFDGESLTCEDGGKYGQIQIHVESIEADVNNIISRVLWPTAPQGWVRYMAAF